MKRPTICAAVIARNEQRDLPKLIASLKGVADHIVVVDTGSTDDTMSVAIGAGATIGVHTRADIYLDASEPNPDKPGEYRIVNFAKARNHALEIAEASGCSHILWADCDDVLMTPLALRRAAYMPKAVVGVWIEIGPGARQMHQRMWPVEFKVRFKGWVHEFPVIDGMQGIVLNDCYFVHDATPHESAGEDSNARNLRILMKQWQAEPDGRCAFYIGNTHRDGGRSKESIEWYRRRLEYGDGFLDEYLFAKLYLARSLADVEQWTAAEEVARDGLRRAPSWQEFRMVLAWVYYKQKDYAAAIKEAQQALDKPIIESILWREKSQYRDQPARIISWCHEHLGNLAQAYVWSQLATRLIGKWDADWQKREAVLEQRLSAPVPQAPGVLKGLRQKIALHRPGAIGDILMTLNLVPAFKEANPGCDVHYFCDARLGRPDALGQFMLGAGIDMVLDCATVEAWRKSYDKVIDLVGYPLAEGYPDRPMQRHLLSYFAEEMGLSLLNLQGKAGLHPRELLPQLALPRPSFSHLASNLLEVDSGFPPLEAGGYATLQMTAGWSKYKQWPWRRWAIVVAKLVESKIPVVMIDESRGWSLSKSIAVFANARMHLGIDSFCNHLTNYIWTHAGGARRVPGVILWGSTQWDAAGYPDNVNISKGLRCQPCFRESDIISRMPVGPCINPPRATYADNTPWACTDAISVDEVMEAARRMWDAQRTE